MTADLARKLREHYKGENFNKQIFINYLEKFIECSARAGLSQCTVDVVGDCGIFYLVHHLCLRLTGKEFIEVRELFEARGFSVIVYNYNQLRISWK